MAERDESYCPFCGEGYGHGDGAKSAWKARDRLKAVEAELAEAKERLGREQRAADTESDMLTRRYQVVEAALQEAKEALALVDWDSTNGAMWEAIKAARSALAGLQPGDSSS